MNLYFEEITAAETHIVSSIKSAIHRFTKRLPDSVLNVTNFVGITDPFSENFNGIRITSRS